jgi:hypothetical protein
MRNGKKVDIDLKEAMQLGRFLNLDKESVLDYFFWSKFLKYLSKSW